MNILVTGSNGQLGSELRKIAATDQLHQWHFTDIDTLDITQEAAVKHIFGYENIEVCINCAAYTAVDKAEDEQDKARLINAYAPKILAEACLNNDALLIHISTDYVFDGRANTPIKEDSPTKPSSVYGITKALGEQYIIESKCRHIILRTAWLYSAVGNNFVKTMLRLADTRDVINVVADQKGSPTWAFDLASIIVYLIDTQGKGDIREIYHYSNEGVATWHDFAQAIMELTEKNCKINPIETKDYPTRASRPAYSVLDKGKIKTHTHCIIPFWRDSLVKCLEEIKRNELKI